MAYEATSTPSGKSPEGALKFTTLRELRKELKKLGYGVLTESMSYGRHATFRHNETGEMLTFNLAPRGTFDKWKPLFEWCKKHKPELDYIAEHEYFQERLYGLTKYANEA